MKKTARPQKATKNCPPTIDLLVATKDPTPAPDPAPKPTRPTVTGRATDNDGNPVADARVVVSTRRLRKLLTLGSTCTDSEGRYTVELGEGHDHDDRAAQRNTLVELREVGTDRLLASAPVDRQGRTTLRVDLVVRGRESLFRSTLRKVAAVGAPADALISQEDHEELTQLTGLTRPSIERYGRATVLASQLTIPARVAFALVSNSKLRTPREVFAAEPARLKQEIEGAVTRGDVDPIDVGEIDDTIGRIQRQSVQAVSSKSIAEGHLNLGALLRLTSSDEATSARVARLWHRHDGTPGRFWSSLMADASLPLAYRNRFRDLSDLGVFAQGDAIVAEALSTSPSIRFPRDLARASAADLAKLLAKPLRRRAGANPAAIANDVVARAREAFPTAAFLSDVRSSIDGDVAAVAPLLDALHDDGAFNLHDIGIDAHLRKSAAFKTLSADQGRSVSEALKLRQRITRLGATYVEAKVLIDAGFGSASQIVARGRNRFAKEVARFIGEDSARALFARAEEAQSKATMLYLQHGPTLNTLGTRVTPRAIVRLDDSPNLQNLFADQPLCACERCRSILGPAAYLVDLLHFLHRDENNAGNVNALEELTRVGAARLGTRRPDLVRIKLTCENTNTPIPYLDVVLEVLENAVATPEAATDHQTTESEEDIAQASEHIVPAAYDRLADSVYPFNLPFDIHYEELRLIVPQLGTTRLELMETFAALSRVDDPAVNPEFLTRTNDNTWNSEAVAGEVFGLSTAERLVITGQRLATNPLPGPGVFWGLGGVGEWTASLGILSDFMSRAGLDYSATLRLLSLKALHRAPGLSLASDDPAECDPSKIRIVGLDALAAGRIHRFLRLQRRSGWAMRDVDRALFALADREADGVPRLDAPFLVRLSHVQRLTGRSGASIPEVLSWWSDLDTADYNADHLPPARSHYQEVFERDSRPSLRGNVLPLVDVLAGAAGAIQDKTVEIAAALALPVEAVETLVTALDLGAQPTTLGGLSLLYRHASLARRMGLTIPAFLAYRALGGDPFLDAAGRPSTTRTLAFLDRYDAYRATAVSLEEVRYYVGGLDRVGAPLAPTDAQLQSVRDAVSSALQASGGDDAARRAAVVRFFAQRSGIDLAVARALLSDVLRSDGGRSFLDELVDPAAPLGDVLLRDIVARLDGVAWFMRVTGRLDVTEVEWVFTRAPALGFLEVALLPMAPADGAAREANFAAWRRWEQWVEVRNQLPEAERKGLVELFRLGSVEEAVVGGGEGRGPYHAKLTSMTGWDAQDVGLLLGRFDSINGARVSLLDTRFRSHFRDEQLPFRVLRCLRLVKRIGLPLSQLEADALLFPEPVVRPAPLVRAARRALRAKVGEEGYAAAISAVRHTMREKQRRALVDHLVGEWQLRDSGALYDHFLLDVEMGACQKTTRIHAATHSVQLFVQRCLMNLEPDVVITQAGAEQWEWMKGYPAWEAARRVFLYPENHLRQELRDDRTPFFREFEDELRQKVISNEAAEDALRHYLEKVDQVSRLQICGIYVEDDAGGSRGEWEKPNQAVHVYGRTRNSPHVYFSRKWFKGLWTAWERVDVDIEGDHLIPVVYFGRLYLFWPVIAEKDGSPFSMDAFIRPFMDLVSFIGSIVETGGAIAMALVAAYNRLVDAFGFDNFRVNVRSINELRGEKGPITYALDLVAKGLKLVFNAVAQRPEFMLLSMLPKKEYSIRLAWSERRHGQWTAKKTSSTQLTYQDVTGPLMRTIDQASPPQSDGPWAADGAFDRKRLFTFNARVEGNEQLVIQAHVTRLGFDVINNDIDGTYVDFLGDFILDDSQASLRARQPQAGSFDFLTRVLEDLQEVALAAVRRALQFVTGEPITLDDDPTGTLKTLVGTELAALAAGGVNNYRVMGAHQYQRRRRASVGPVERAVGPNWYEDTEDLALENQYFIQDSLRTFWYWNKTFHTHYHPFVGELVRQLNRHGLEDPGLMAPAHQSLTRPSDFSRYDPVASVRSPAIDIDYSVTGAYSVYNWEMFVHAPLLVAEMLKAQHRHADAERWLHLVFDPTDRRPEFGPSKYWRPRVFAEAAGVGFSQESIGRLMLGPADGSRSDLEVAVEDWQRSPFAPFAVARLRTSAFQRGVVMLYVKNLIAWGDQLFREDTMASVMAAALLYRRAEELLGPRPTEVFARQEPPAKTYAELSDDLDSFSNAMVELENLVWDSDRYQSRATRGPVPGYGRAIVPRTQGAPDAARAGANKTTEVSALRDRWRTFTHSAWFGHVATPSGLYFCIPKNEKLLHLWSVVAERLSDIRNCRNIDGASRVLSEEGGGPTSRESRRAGLDSADDVGRVVSPVPLYRFVVMIQRALELCNDVKSAGAAMLGAMEKKDAEHFAQFKQDQELAMLEAIRRTKQLAVDEAEASLRGLGVALQMAERRREFYALNLASPVSGLEAAQLALFGTGIGLQALEAAITGVASGLSLVPDVLMGFPIAATQTGGSSMAKSSELAAQALGRVASIANASGSMVGIMAGYDRRTQEWELQNDLAEREIEQVNAQIRAAEIRLQSTQHDLKNHELQAEQNRATSDFLRSKFTNATLYDYMVDELSTLHETAYGMAFEVARQAESAYRMERGEPLDAQPRLIRSGPWNSMRGGLMAGEALYAALREMEARYRLENKRSLEIQDKKVSLRQFFPRELMELKERGWCDVPIQEWHFDLDHAGHYRRQIKSVAISIPCVAGPYASVNCSLTLIRNRVRINERGLPEYNNEAGQFYERYGREESIVTSHARSDNGLWQMDLRDERYLPFEGAGVDSTWRIELPKETNQFDLGTVSDVLLHFNYSAVRGSEALRAAALANLRATLPSAGWLWLDIGETFPTEWNRFLTPPENGADQGLKFTLKAEHFPFVARGRRISIRAIHQFAASPTPVPQMHVELTPPGLPPAVLNDLVRDGRFGELFHAEATWAGPIPALGEWSLKLWLDGAVDRRSTTRSQLPRLVWIIGYDLT